MSFKILPISVFSVLASFAVGATEFPYNGYIIKVKNGSDFLSSQSFVGGGAVSEVRETSFGTFGKLEVGEGFSRASLQALAAHPEVEYIEPNYIVSITSSGKPEDDKFKNQWGLNNDGRNGALLPLGKSGEDINVLKAWNITKGNKDLKIAVIDTGVDYNHPDLKAQMDINWEEFYGLPGVDNDGNGYVGDIYGYSFADQHGDPMDKHGHGTHCAGVIGAEHNSIGIAGVMANVKIVAIKFLSDSGSGETINAIASIDYAIKREVNIMSNSWGGGRKNQALLEAIQAANDAGIVFVASAGNSSSNNDTRPSYPASYEVPNVISVGSFTLRGAKSNFSNHGVKSVHVSAPGSSILSTYKGGYSKLSGTSMSAPHVSGVAGLLLSAEPNLTPEEVRERLIRTSTKTSALKSASLSGGRVDAHRALLNQ